MLTDRPQQKPRRRRSWLSLRTKTSRLAGGARPPHPPANSEVWRRGGESCELERHQPTLTDPAKAGPPPWEYSSPAAPI